MYTPYEIFKYWLPLATGFLMVWSGFKSAKTLLKASLDKLLNNHLHHIEENTLAGATALKDTHAEFITLRAEQQDGFKTIHDTLHARFEMDAKIQQSILTNLEILKDRMAA